MLPLLLVVHQDPATGSLCLSARQPKKADEIKRGRKDGEGELIERGMSENKTDGRETRRTTYVRSCMV